MKKSQNVAFGNITQQKRVISNKKRVISNKKRVNDILGSR